MTTPNSDNITPLTQFGVPADVAAAICSTFYKLSKTTEECDEMHAQLIDEIAAAKGLI